MTPTYGKNNRERGIYYMLCRLTEEMHEAEAAHLFDKADDQTISLSERRRETALEFADVFAWIFSIAGVLELDLESAIHRRYGGNCPNCDKKPCNCPSPVFTQSTSVKRIVK